MPFSGIFHNIKSRLDRRRPSIVYRRNQGGRISKVSGLRSWLFSRRRASTSGSVSPTTNEVQPTSHPETYELPEVERVWFQRRKSSLNRISAASMRFTEEIRSPRPQTREFTFIPLVLDAESSDFWKSEGVIMEMEILKQPGSIPCLSLSFGTSRKSSWSSAVSSLSNNSRLSISFVQDEDHDSPPPSPQYNPKRRPIPIQIRARPAAIEASTCQVSDTPLSQMIICGSWNSTPTTARSRGSIGTTSSQRSSGSRRPPTVRSVATMESNLIFEWWN